MSNIALSSAMRANLTSLQQTAQLMDQTQLRLSTLKSVNSVTDDPVKFFTSQALSSRASILDGVKSGISSALNTISAATTGVDSIKESISSLESVVAQARTIAGKSDSDSNTLRADLVNQYNDLLDQIDNTVEDSSYNGVNLLKASTSLRVNFNEDASTSRTVAGFDANYSALGSGGAASGSVSVAQTSDTVTATLGTAGTVVATDGASVAASTVDVTFGNTSVSVTNFNTNSQGSTSASAGDVTITLSNGGTVNLDAGSTVVDGNVQIARAANGDLTVTYDDNGDGTFAAGTSSGDDAVSITFAGTGGVAGGVTSTINGTAAAYTSTVTMTNTTGTYTVGTADGTSGGGTIGGSGGAGLGRLTADATGSALDTDTELDTLVTRLSSARTYLDKESSNMGANVSMLTTRSNFLTSLMDTLNAGSDDLTQADTNLEGANMLALQTRQQLGVTSLSLASQALQGVLRLF